MSTPTSRPLTRRALLKTAAGSVAWLAGAPWVRRARGAGELRVALAHHWVPEANDAARAMIDEGCARLGLRARVDFYPTVGRQQMEQIAREAREGVGHDLTDLPYHLPYVVRNDLEPLDDMMAELIRRHGKPTVSAVQVGRVEGVWQAAPSPFFNHSYPQVARLDYWKRFAGTDLRGLFPPHGQRDAAAAAGWTWEAYLVAARRLHATGHPVGNPISPSSDANDWLGALFLSFGSVAADADGNIAIDSDGTRAALEYVTRLVEVMPPEVFEWDDAGNNRHLVSGTGSAIFNPPSAWALARRTRPEVAAQLWHHDVPAGPAGRFRGAIPRSLGVWRFSRHKEAARQLILYLWEPESQRRLLAAAQGYDLPQFSRYNEHPVWRTAAPPAGTLYNYPVRGDEQLIHAGYPAPPAMAAGIYSGYLLPNLVTRVVRGGESFDAAIAWAVRELKSYRG